MHIPAQTTCPTSIFYRQITYTNLDFPVLYEASGLMVPNHHGDIAIMLQNCSCQNIEIPRNATMGFL